MSPRASRRRRRVAVGALAAAALLLAAPAGAAVARVEAVGAAPAGEGAPAAVAPRQAALEDALGQAVLRVAAGLLPASDAPPELAALLGDARPAEFIVSYRILEDRGVGPPLLLGDTGAAAEHVLRVEAQVDAGRLAAHLRTRGLAGGPAEAAGGPGLALAVEGLHSWGAYARLRDHLVGRIGARSALPEAFEPGRAVLRVEMPGGAGALAERLRTAAPEGLRIEEMRVEGDSLRLRVTDLQPPPEPSGAGTAFDTR